MAYDFLGNYQAVSDAAWYDTKFELQAQALKSLGMYARFKLWLDDSRSPANQKGEKLRQCWIDVCNLNWKDIADIDNETARLFARELAHFDNAQEASK